MKPEEAVVLELLRGLAVGNNLDLFRNKLLALGILC